MIGQYLSNNNEKRYNVILPKILDLNQPYIEAWDLKMDSDDSLTQRFQ
jgi:hypothetical protein